MKQVEEGMNKIREDGFKVIEALGLKTKKEAKTKVDKDFISVYVASFIIFIASLLTLYIQEHILTGIAICGIAIAHTMAVLNFRKGV